ncbi:23S rRNA (guanosine(2251)-2'-O)-methyltransferase RlmB [Verrucomicrobia bacterium S94]|nr:23S rRNA (guanosine(2251)-2'-O)-methyltransferase RlmB [Verrucomicrobia bacterium S94]
MRKQSKRRADQGRNSSHGRSNKHSTGVRGRARMADESELEALLAGVEQPLILILDSLQDPHNLGACIRSANAAGADAVIMPRDRAVGVTDTAMKVSCGGASETPLFRVKNLARTIDLLKQLGIRVAGTSDHQGTQNLYEADISGPIAVMAGSEEKGVRRLSMDKCDLLLSIPMAGCVPCLNVSVAVGICLFEVVRQRSLG